MKPFLFVLLGTLSVAMNVHADFAIPGPSARAPVVHIGRYHILTCGRTSVVLDGIRGLSLVLIGEREAVEKARGGLTPRIGPCSLQVELTDGTRRIVLDQANDPAPRLQIISQGPTHAAARLFFSLCAADGKVYGTGTLDITVYEDRVHLVPSLFVDDLSPKTRVVRAGLSLEVAEGSGLASVRGKKTAPPAGSSFESFGDASVV